MKQDNGRNNFTDTKEHVIFMYFMRKVQRSTSFIDVKFDYIISDLTLDLFMYGNTLKIILV